MGRFDRAPVDRAAGGVLADPSGRVAVVHRPRYDDWALPKGHVGAGESWEEAAVREVTEETGWTVQIEAGPYTVAYPLPDGRPKIVVFYRMRPTGLEARSEPDADEVDRIDWWTPARCVEELTYAVESDLVEALFDVGPRVLPG